MKPVSGSGSSERKSQPVLKEASVNTRKSYRSQFNFLQEAVLTRAYFDLLQAGDLIIAILCSSMVRRTAALGHVKKL